MPLISVITINYNNAEGLRKTLLSTFAQTYKDFEYIIVDGGSTDGSRELIAEYEVCFTKWVSEADDGIYDAMNKGVALASGEYVLFMNSGDVFFNEDVLARVHPLMGRKRDFYTGGIIHRKRCLKAPAVVSSFYLFNQALPHQATFIRRSLLAERGYRLDIPIVADWEQQVYELLVCDATYEALDVVVSVYDATGVSSQSVACGDIDRHVIPMLRKHFSGRMIDSLRVPPKTPLYKLHKALSQRQSFKDDLRVIRYGLKLLLSRFVHTTSKAEG